MPEMMMPGQEPSPFDNQSTRNEVVDMLEGKVGREDAGYLNVEQRERMGIAEEEMASCAMCMHYLSPGKPESKCAVVTGTVEAGGVCDMFDPSVSGQGESTAVEGPQL